MSNWLHDLYDTMKRSEKEMLIRRSGSTQEGKNEKIRSGQSYLYKRYGMESEVMEVRFKDKITGDFLNQALLTAMKRYPYFNTKLVEKDGDFYIVQNEQSMIARRTKELARLGHISCGYHLIDITYYGYSIYISFHHALCDGRGVMPFIETLIYYYCDLKYGRKPVPEGVRLADDPLLPGETDDPFLQEYDFDGKKMFVNIAADMRDALGVPNTFKNCVKSMNLPYSREFSEKSLTEQTTEYRELLKAQRDRDFCRKEANAMIGLSNKLDTLDSYEEKQKIMTFFEGMTLNTYIISYLGAFRLGENAQYISEIHLYNSGTTGLGINMISCGENFVLDFKQNFQSDKYVRAFCEELEKLGIAYTVSDRIPFVTPGDSIIKR